MKIALLFLLMTSQTVLGASQNEHLEKVLLNLAPKLDKKELAAFKYKKCETQKEKWVLLFATQIPFEENIKFSGQCDIEGKFTVKMGEFFPFTLQVANIKGLKQLSGKMKFAIVFTDKTLLKIELIKAKYRNEKMEVQKEFQVAYSFVIDPLNPTKIIKRDLGGKLDIISNGKISKSIKLTGSPQAAP